MLKQQLAKGNNGLVKSKYITFSIEADNIREAKPKLERIESDILNNFKILGVPAYPLNGVERLQILYETFNPDIMTDFQLCAQLRVCSQAGGNPVYPRFSQPDNSESWDDVGNGI